MEMSPSSNRPFLPYSQKTNGRLEYKKNSTVSLRFDPPFWKKTPKIEVFTFYSLFEGETLRKEQFLLFATAFFTPSFQRTFHHFHQFQNCWLQTFSVWKSLKIVLCESVQTDKGKPCTWSLTLSLLMMKQAFVDSVDQDQTAQNMQSHLWSSLSTFSF